MTRGRSFLVLVFCLATCFGAAALGALANAAALETWYPGIAKPSWTPPGAVFGPVWTALYAMMAVAAWLVWTREGFAKARLPLGLFAVQLAFNAAWSWLFFYLRNPLAGLVDIALLWLALLATMVSFFRRRRLAGLLLVPYLLWVSFAAALNAAIYWLNR